MRKGTKVRTTKVLNPHWRFTKMSWVQRHQAILVGAVGVMERTVAASRGGRPGMVVVRFEFTDEPVGVPWDSLEAAPD